MTLIGIAGSEAGAVAVAWMSDVNIQLDTAPKNITEFQCVSLRILVLFYYIFYKNGCHRFVRI